MKRLTQEEFISRATKKYGNRFDYSKVEFVNLSTRVRIVCPDHGEFLAIPNNFLKGHNCPICSGRQRITQEVFIERSSKIHKGRYDYSKVDYHGLFVPVCIICPDHGEFWQKPSVHLNGSGCQKCFATPKSNTSEFIRKAKEVYGDSYDYSKVEYKGNKTKVCITCPQHGDFWVTPNNFLRGSRCPGCYGTPKYTTEEFIEKANKIYGNKYDYSKTVYDGLKKKVLVICPIHGEFWQTASTHLNGVGCLKCSGHERITLDSFIERAKSNHTIQYDYSKVDLSDKRKKVCIVCPEHGEFYQSIHRHLSGANCPKCVGGIKLTTEEFIEKAKAVHGEKYDYSKVEYKNTATKVCIICREHGEFWQTPNNHLFGAGCPTCPQSNLEGDVRLYLQKNDIVFEQEKTFDWLRSKKKMFLDFYLPEYEVAIECQGLQHFVPCDLFGGQSFYQKTLKRDKEKKELCEQHGIEVLYFSHADVDYPYPVIEKYSDLLTAIKHRGKIEIKKDEQYELPF